MRYLTMAVFSAAITLSVPLLLHEVLGVREQVAVAAALGTAFVVNFIGLRSFVFRSKGKAQIEFIRYGLTSAMMRVGEYFCFLLLFDLLDLHYYVAFAATLIIFTASKFLIHRAYVFRREPSTAE